VEAAWSGKTSITVLSSPPPTTTVHYIYDPLYRLTGANYSGAYTYAFAYAYDAVGNRTAQTITSTLVTTYIYDAANRLTSVNGQAYTWDNNGNLTNNGSKTYLYNQANQLTGITAPGLTLRLRSGQAWSTSYNGDGARLRQIVNGVPTTYTLDLAAPLVTALTERTGATTKQYLYGQGDSPMAVYSGTTWTYLSGRDGLNSVRQETDASGNVTAVRSFDPYGVPLSGGGGSPFGYTGEIADVTGLVFLRARYLQPGLGMFLSRDPLLTESPYRYASGNPINRSDPSGYIDWPMCANAIPYRICTTEEGDNIWDIARLINNAGIGLPGNDQAIRQIASTIYGDNELRIDAAR
jgi:RHS repeat-associated protein